VLYARLIGEPWRFGDVAYLSKKLILDSTMSSELHMLTRRLDRISEQHRWSRDFTLFSLQQALAEVIACFPVYRTYIRAAKNTVGDEDRHHILAALRTAKRRNPAMSESIFDFIASVLLLQDPEGLSVMDRDERREFVMRFQQLTGPVMAKGIEDTAFYRVYPLASLNEVGGNPERFGLAVDTFHRHNAERLANWPQALLTTATHDTKRGEDVRARLNVLSEIPREWERAVQRWRSMNRDKKVEVDGVEVPDANEEYLLYQTLVGAWPPESMDEVAHQTFVERVERYMEKALKEAKLHTSWINPNEAYDQAVKQFVRDILRPQAANRFVADLLRFEARIAPAGMWNALAQTLLKIASPGVPDFYQGTELWDLSLVDPDNRRPVDFSRRVSMLDELQQLESKGLVALVRDLVASPQDGRIKLYVTSKALNVRRTHHQLFRQGAYLPLMASGAQHDHVVAFARHLDAHWALVVVPRLLMNLSPVPKPLARLRVRMDRFPRLAMNLSSSVRPPLGKRLWKETLLRLPAGAPNAWRNIFTDERLVVSDRDGSGRGLFVHEAFRRLPVALLIGSNTDD